MENVRAVPSMSALQNRKTCFEQLSRLSLNAGEPKPYVIHGDTTYNNSAPYDAKPRKLVELII